MKSWIGPDEGAPLLAPPRSSAAPAGDRIRIRALVWTLATCMAIFGFELFIDPKFGGPLRWRTPSGPGHRTKTFKWSQIDSSEDFKFHQCFREFECAKLRVPLDYFNGTHPDEYVSIAVTKLPAIVPVDDSRYGGPIVINPGGPGGPGALFALGVGKSLQTIVDSAIHPNIEATDAKYYDIIGFDPRGIGETEPAAYCTDDYATSWSWTLRENAVGLLGSSDASLGRLWSMSHAWGSACKDAMDEEDGPDIKQYMATAFVARDMLQIVEKHAAYVANTVSQLDFKKNRMRAPETAPVTSSEAKLDYWGFSYGTFLGSTFASMFPDRVGRVILDGVVSSYDYEHALGNGSLTDNQKVMSSFYTYCVYAGPDHCPLATPDATFADIRKRVDKIVQSLYHNPLILKAATGAEVLTYSDVRTLIFSALYQPTTGFPQVAQLLYEIEAGHGELLDLIGYNYQYRNIYSCSAEPIVDYTSYVPTFAILCADGFDQSRVDIDEFAAYWELLEGISPAAGAVWSMLLMRCAAWKIQANYRYQGPFGGNTSNPILFVSNTADPVTPLRSGRIMHTAYPNSGLLVSDHAGHCSIASPNLCTLGHIKTYYQTGKLPPPNTLCVPPPSPFSLNSTDPKSPFYDPEIGGMEVELATSAEGCGQVSLHQAGQVVAKAISAQDFFGVGKLVGGQGDLVREFMSISAQYFHVR
ncbi:hypothetical protein CC86DRAFT_463216 [Ophiobolus disseminans]|uniref:Peptidase S33 tripeptidyl aminopeptidase-like C-terminal domain-containing protein n=1 Tax=Ophiobolus disseminans TaxID=1469910 RepID=A0A6A7ADH2_9PLEO|nr:hypothetical protein CC86DRAFT_463216 [Ophiobolus disseminans]